MNSIFESLVRSNKVKLGACATFAFAGACASQAMIKKPALEEAPASFFRVTADYTVIETGEEIRFDYVVGCGGIVANYSYTTPSVIYEAHPTMQYMATQDGAAIGIKSPGVLCDQSYFEFVPEDFRPFTMWFPDVQDMSFALGYATEIAYESKNTHVKFNGASVVPATEAEWRDNRSNLATEYEQVGALPGPWGHSFSRGPTEEIVSAALKGKGYYLASECNGYSRLELEPQLVEELFASAPENTGRYWLMDNATYSPVWERLRGPNVEVNGHRFNDHLKRADGTIQRSGGGTIRLKFDYRPITDVFPLLPIRQSMENSGSRLTEPAEEYFRTVLLESDWNGFTACMSGGDPTFMPSRTSRLYERPEFMELMKTTGRRNPFDPEARDKPIWLDFNSLRLGEIPERESDLPWILDREGYIYFHNGWGFHRL